MLALDSKDVRRLALRLRRDACRCTQWHVIGSIAAILLLWWHWLSVTEVVHRSCYPDQPLAIVRQQFLPRHVFSDIQTAASGDALVETNQLNEENFKYTRGWLMKFNREGLARVRGNDSWAYAVRYFDAVENPEANAFVMNLLVAEQPPPSEGDAVGPHYDDTIDVDAPGQFMAHQVNVLYTSVPQKLRGGELEVWPYEHDNTELDKAIITPAENTMVEFRGDACHRVRGFWSPSGARRISIVVEQYRIPEKLYKHTREFCFSSECDE
ncbi:unnamed protein product [Ostreobium quekettii]|uniref:Fe2OG dioxygenase domain-containing protein n=1 Tax=Ostreobium quekettii TaxID=121088 RepID=A0A8S1J597_9CHLO|nr:unnamed protein product [Ostreobium quekettii]|eukprot:evm.model.scf_1550.2 EVM.evm.TU.scf_1550.2   scf_1550:6354-8795(+)